MIEKDTYKKIVKTKIIFMYYYQKASKKLEQNSKYYTENRISSYWSSIGELWSLDNAAKGSEFISTIVFCFQYFNGFIIVIVC